MTRRHYAIVTTTRLLFMASKLASVHLAFPRRPSVQYRSFTRILMSSETNSRILFISLFARPWFNRKYAKLMSRILAVASLEQAHRPIPALRALAENPKAVFVTDEAVSLPGYAAVLRALLRYIQDGGTAIFMGHFSCRLPIQRFRVFFSRAGLQWEFDEYTRCQSLLNTDFLPREITDILPATHYGRAVYLKNVGDTAWYRPKCIVKSDSETETGEIMDLDSKSNGDEPIETTFKDSAPVAMAQVGQGYLGFVGDVNSSEESNLVMIAMCGLYV